MSKQRAEAQYLIAFAVGVIIAEVFTATLHPSATLLLAPGRQREWVLRNANTEHRSRYYSTNRSSCMQMLLMQVQAMWIA